MTHQIWGALNSVDHATRPIKALKAKSFCDAITQFGGNLDSITGKRPGVVYFRFEGRDHQCIRSNEHWRNLFNEDGSPAEN